MRRPDPLARLWGASLLMDGSFYLLLTAIPLQAAELHASSLQLGFLAVLGSGVYVAAALLFGRLSDRGPRMAMARLGAWLRAGASLAFLAARSVPLLMAFMPLLGVANGLFWPGLQAAVGEARPEGELRRNLGGFNVSWSTGKMFGFLIGGIILARRGSQPVFVLAAVLAVVVAVLLPNVRPHADWSESRLGAGASGALDRARHGSSWRRIGWLANFTFFGIGAILNYHYPKLLLSIGLTGQDFGIFLGLIYFFQTLAFIFLARWAGWHFRSWPLLVAQSLGLVSLALLVFLRTRFLIWATAPGIGLGLGLSYSSSIYYSLYHVRGRGRSTGIHEGLLGTGTFMLPFLGGGLAQATGSLLAPYLVGAGALLVTMAIELAWARDRGDVAPATAS